MSLNQHYFNRVIIISLPVSVNNKGFRILLPLDMKRVQIIFPARLLTRNYLNGLIKYAKYTRGNRIILTDICRFGSSDEWGSIPSLMISTPQRKIHIT